MLHVWPMCARFHMSVLDDKTGEKVFFRDKGITPTVFLEDRKVPELLSS